ncbi:hypothetical protein [Mycobacterium colombiense]|uniref:hypothetical protein n=1 Tax=Mycobacterium colombiense TaxID=339268 RepID=UPI00197C1CD5|nr:hypothetical protein [Mycobacterium colombiense]
MRVTPGPYQRHSSRTSFASRRRSRPGTDLTIMLYTAEPGTEDAERLALLAVIGAQSLVG